ncbi:MAG TPA: SAM-dependent methyltransferase [Bryobacteraceae bacterium]|jgi:methyltransferase (TIGR00027 family)
MSDRIVSNVSDTARWVAVYRARESARPDRLFSDPLAARLAGEHGEAIAALAPGHMRSGWPMVVRTRLMDDLVLASVRDGCDCVVNLAAGLDTRPYRLPLPASLNWIEADLPEMIEEKNRLLAAEKPVCGLHREKVDLTDTTRRADFLDRVTRASNQVLVITEGLLLYLGDDAVQSLARDLASRESIRWWILEINSPAIQQMMQRDMGDHLAQAPLKFAPPDGVAFFETLGWKAVDIHSIVREAVRFRRAPLFLRLFSLFPEPDPRNLGMRSRWSGVARFERRGYSTLRATTGSSEAARRAGK